jgi:hypothetical protein
MTADHVRIRGVTLALDRLVDTQRLAAPRLGALKHAFASASPFPHLVIDGLFEPTLLDLVAQEFELLDASRWRRSYDGQHERTLRSLPGSRLGPAAELYFGMLHSGWFVETLQQLTGIGALVTDPQLHDGGFHESRRGGRFRIHADFDTHRHTALHNELVLITYLNRDWDPQWCGALELWSAQPRQCVHRIEPVFGRTVLMRHSPVSFHGHPTPLRLPPDRTRRSLAAYYYSHRGGETAAKPRRHDTRFMERSLPRVLHHGVRQLMPPLLWNAAKRLVRR